MGRHYLSLCLALIATSSLLISAGNGEAKNTILMKEATLNNLELFARNSSIHNPLQYELIKQPQSMRIKGVSSQLKEIESEEEWMYFELTAYNNNEKSTGKKPGDSDYGITASGAKTKAGVTIAADWRVLPKGTKVYIEGVGERVVQDKGGAIKGHKIDVYLKTEKECIEFGRKKNVKVKIIEMGD